MKLYRCYRACPVAVFLLLGINLPLSAVAQQSQNTAQGFNPYVQAGYTYDTNLFRVTDSEEGVLLLRTPELSDHFFTYEAGLDSRFQNGKQEFELSGRVYRNVYDLYTDNNFTGANALATWNWAGRDRWNGEFAYQFDRNLRDFSLQTVPRKDVRIRHRFQGEAARVVGQNTQLTFRAGFADIGSTGGDSLDQENVSGGVSFDYVTDIGNSVGIEADYVDGRFKSNSLRDYTQASLGPTITWNASPITTLTGRVAYTRRSHDNDPVEDFDGVTARVRLNWRPSPDTRVVASVFRILSNLGDQISTYAIVHGVSIEPTWQVGSRTALRFMLGYENREYQAEPGLVLPPTATERTDKVSVGGVWLDWQTTDALSFTAGVSAGDRSSNRNLASYDYQTAEVHVRFGF